MKDHIVVTPRGYVTEDGNERDFLLAKVFTQYGARQMATKRNGIAIQLIDYGKDTVGGLLAESVRGRLHKALLPNGEKLSEARRAAHMTQNDLADRLQVTQTYISKIESGITEGTKSFMKRAADAIGMVPQ